MTGWYDVGAAATLPVRQPVMPSVQGLAGRLHLESSLKCSARVLGEAGCEEWTESRGRDILARFSRPARAEVSILGVNSLEATSA
jgi:hypothetical protein